MESGNSSSIQSSSGGDDEYDSQADSISSFLTPPSRVGFIASHPHHPPPPPPSASSLGPLSAYLDAFPRTPPLAPSSDPIINCTGMVGPAWSAAPPPYTSFPTPIGPSQRPYVVNINMGPLPSPSSLLQQPPAAPPEQPPSGVAAPSPRRGSKKRLRASRRAPTTVLTTDTSNFRAMVQEFTGVPSPPFPSPAFPGPRLDLLRAGAYWAGRSTGMPDAMPGYLLRPFAQKVPVPFASGSSASSSACAIIGVSGSTGNVSTTTTSAAAAGAASSTGANASMTGAAAAAAAATASSTSVTDSTSTATTNSHHLPSDVGLGSRHQNLLSMFNLQSFLPLSSAAKHNNSPNAPNHGMATSPQLTAEAAAAYGIGDDGDDPSHASAAHLGTLLPCFAATEGLSSSRGGGDAGGDDVLRWFEGSGAGTDGEDRGQFRSTGGSCGDRQRGNSCKLNCTGSASSDYHPEKGSDNVPASRGEGMVASWICSSD